MNLKTDTIKLKNKNDTLFIAHRGLSGLERENTASAFVAACNRSYYGVETDVHVTSDGKYVIIHDDTTARVAESDIEVEKSTLDSLRALRVKDMDGTFLRGDLMLPTLSEYINICKRYDKIAVLELKNLMSRDNVYGIYDEVKRLDYLKNTIFISFFMEDLMYIKERDNSQPAQFLCAKYDDALLEKLKQSSMDIDILFKAVDEAFVRKCHDMGIKVNVWTVDSTETAEYLIGCSVDFITTNILE